MSDFEDRLSGYRPAGPPAALRARVLAAARAAGPQPSRDPAQWWRWLPAAAAALVTIVFYTLSAGARADVAARLSAADRAREAMVADLASQLGGDELARQSAERLVEANEQAARGSVEALGGKDVQVTNRD